MKTITKKKKKNQTPLTAHIENAKDHSEDVPLIESKTNHVRNVTHYSIALELMEYQKRRSGLIKMMNAQRSQIMSYITRIVGYNSFQDEKERKQKWELAGKIFDSIVKEETPPAGQEQIASLCAIPALAVKSSLIGLAKERAQIEDEMIQRVKNLPVCDWWVSVKGRSYLGLAIIIGEAGDLSGYENPAKLWKRFGLAVMDGVRQGGLSKTAKAEEWIEHGYCPRRRSALWTIGDSLMKTNGADGIYKKIYDDRKEYEIKRLKQEWIEAGHTEKSFKPGHAHNRAKRFMEKRLLLDLWNKWNVKT